MPMKPSQTKRQQLQETYRYHKSLGALQSTVSESEGGHLEMVFLLRVLPYGWSMVHPDHSLCGPQVQNPKTGV